MAAVPESSLALSAAVDLCPILERPSPSHLPNGLQQPKGLSQRNAAIRSENSFPSRARRACSNFCLCVDPDRANHTGGVLPLSLSLPRATVLSDHMLWNVVFTPASARQGLLDCLHRFTTNFSWTARAPSCGFLKNTRANTVCRVWMSSSPGRLRRLGQVHQGWRFRRTVERKFIL